MVVAAPAPLADWQRPAAVAAPSTDPLVAACRGTVLAPQVETPAAVPDVNASATRERDAEDAIRSSDTARALALLSPLVLQPGDPHMPRACELVGLLRERAGSQDDARAVYQAYLLRFPQDEGAPRVRQRLAALGDRTAPIARAAAPGSSVAAASRASLRGIVSQFYLHDRSKSVFLSAQPATASTNPDLRDNVDELLSVADISGRATLGTTRIEARASFGHVSEYRPVILVGADRNRGSYDLLDQLYLDIATDHGNASVRIGRQVRYGSGIFGRFDGVRAGVDLRPNVRLNAVAGFPVWSERQTSVDRSRAFYGLSAELTSSNGQRAVSVYWFDQRAAGLVDRRAVGIEGRLTSRLLSISGLVDYDVAFATLDAALVNASIRLGRTSNVTVLLQQFHAPTLALTNAALGQSTPSLDVVRDLLAPDALRQAARDRTLLTRSASVTYTRDLSPAWHIIVDGSVFDTSASPASFGVPGFPAAGTEFAFGVQAIGEGLWMPRDTWLVGLRSAILQRSHLYAGDLTVRLPIAPRLTVAPRLRLALRDQRLETGNQRVLAPSVRIVWRLTHNTELEAECGGNFSWQRYTTQRLTGSRFERAFIGHIGYRIRF
ncbi:hypothetical protein [Sphingomonas sp. CARO-RG-8B-R24-01]|uniref:hypothetical protein n=1 Tax=Sphingomonas sp. CARO-RG-8B-R24-01 TaxID=2914831 RepID=UPI001F593422|nr:hypothetical protein [Sphingomonas sp. CARO-RG-8B-R24-01]